MVPTAETSPGERRTRAHQAYNEKTMVLRAKLRATLCLPNRYQHMHGGPLKSFETQVIWFQRSLRQCLFGTLLGKPPRTMKSDHEGTLVTRITKIDQGSVSGSPKNQNSIMTVIIRNVPLIPIQKVNHVELCRRVALSDVQMTNSLPRCWDSGSIPFTSRKIMRKPILPRLPRADFPLVLGAGGYWSQRPAVAPAWPPWFWEQSPSSW